MQVNSTIDHVCLDRLDACDAWVTAAGIYDRRQLQASTRLSGLEIAARTLLRLLTSVVKDS